MTQKEAEELLPLLYQARDKALEISNRRSTIDTPVGIVYSALTRAVGVCETYAYRLGQYRNEVIPSERIRNTERSDAP